MANETSTFGLPSLRDIFYRSELAEYTTPEYDKMNDELTAAIKAVCNTFKERAAIECAATAQTVEAQATGFEQGVAFAMQILASTTRIPRELSSIPRALTGKETQQHE